MCGELNEPHPAFKQPIHKFFKAVFPVTGQSHTTAIIKQASPMNRGFQDLCFALRMLAKNPGFAIIAVLTLAVGIGANTPLFSAINGVLLNPLPYWHSDRLVTLYARTPQFDRTSISYPNFLDRARENHSFSGIAGIAETTSI